MMARLQHECSLFVNVAPHGESFVAVFPLTLKWSLAAFFHPQHNFMEPMNAGSSLMGLVKRSPS